MKISLLAIVLLLCLTAASIAGDIADHGMAIYGDPMSPEEARSYFTELRTTYIYQLNNNDLFENLNMIAHTVVGHDPEANDLLDSLLHFNVDTGSQQSVKLMVLSEFQHPAVRDTIYSYLNDNSDGLRAIAARYAINVYDDTTTAMPVVRSLGAKGLDVLAMISPEYWAIPQGTFQSVIADTVRFTRKMLAATMMGDSSVLDSLFRTELAAANPNDNMRSARKAKLESLDGILRNDLQSSLPDVVTLLADKSDSVVRRAVWVLYTWAGGGNANAATALEMAAANTQLREYTRVMCKQYLEKLGE